MTEHEKTIITMKEKNKTCYNIYIDPVSIGVLKSASFFIEKTEPERGGLPTVLLNPRDCTLLAGSIRPSLSGF